MMNILKIEPKEEPFDENEPDGQYSEVSALKSAVEIDVKREFLQQSPTENEFEDVRRSDILELSDRELAKRIYQAETGIKYLYFVLIKKTEQMRFLAKARKLKSTFVEQNSSKECMLGRSRRKSLANFDPSCADYRALQRVLMSDEERAEMYRKRSQRQRERKEQMTEAELEEERAKARQKAGEKRARMNAGQRKMANRRRTERRRLERKRPGNESPEKNE
ncbi:hypothetical protein GPALN_016324 [Globodera pallida]|nr:hypothetical protein GPALN_016324 [Globodera pallida]